MSHALASLEDFTPAEVRDGREACVEGVARPNPGYLQFKAMAAVVAWWCVASAVAECAWSAPGHLQATYIEG